MAFKSKQYTHINNIICDIKHKKQLSSTNRIFIESCEHHKYWSTKKTIPSVYQNQNRITPIRTNNTAPDIQIEMKTKLAPGATLHSQSNSSVQNNIWILYSIHKCHSFTSYQVLSFDRRRKDVPTYVAFYFFFYSIQYNTFIILYKD